MQDFFFLFRSPKQNKKKKGKKMEFCVLNKSKTTPSRNYDIYYDNTITLPGAKDYYREATKAFSAGTVYKLCPRYESMFSDTESRHVMVIKSSGKPPDSFDKWKANQMISEFLPGPPLDLKGSHRTLFFKQPTQAHQQPTSVVLVHLQATHISPQTLPTGEGLYPQPKALKMSIMRKRKSSSAPPPPVKPVTMVTKFTQTDYRDSETQTFPWAHDFISLQDDDTEIFALKWFKWDENVPPGVHEINLIERTRQRSAWENALPKVRDKTTESRRKSLVAMMETNDTAFRETEIDAIHQQRIDLSKKKLRESTEKSQEKLQVRLERLWQAKRLENDGKVEYWNHQFLRTMRKMNLDRNKINKKYHKWDIVTLYKDKTSELYAPQLRFGENPSRRHETIDIQCRFLKRYRGFEVLERKATKSPTLGGIKFDYNEASKPKKGGGMCPKAISYTEVGLEKLHSDIKAIRSKEHEKQIKEELALRKPLPRPDSLSPTVEEIPDWQEDLYQSSLIISKTVKGRAIQTQFLSTIEERPASESE